RRLFAHLHHPSLQIINPEGRFRYYVQIQRSVNLLLTFNPLQPVHNIEGYGNHYNAAYKNNQNIMGSLSFCFTHCSKGITEKKNDQRQSTDRRRNGCYHKDMYKNRCEITSHPQAIPFATFSKILSKRI